MKKKFIGMSILLLSLCASFALFLNASAIEGTITYRRIMKNAIETYDLGEYKVNNKQAFCMYADLDSPIKNMKVKSKPYNNLNMRKVLYYGYDGVNNIYFKEHKYTVDAQKGVTSLASDWARSGKLHTTRFKQLNDFVSWIKKQGDPNVEGYLQFSKTSSDTYITQDQKYQRTSTIKIKGSSHLTTTLNSGNDKVTLVNETTKKSGKSIQVKGGDSFYLRSSIGYQGTITMKMEAGAKVDTITEWVTDSGKYQNLVNATFKKMPTSLKVNFINGYTSFHLYKDVKSTSLNVSHDLSGATYVLTHKQSQKTYTLVVNEKGEAKVDNIVEGDYTLKETKAPLNQKFKLDETNYQIKVERNKQGIFKYHVSDEIKTASIKLKKVDENQHPIENVVFNIYADEDFEDFKKDQLVSSLTTNKSGEAVSMLMGLGHYYVKEVKVPEGYILDDQSFKVNLNEEGQVYEIGEKGTVINYSCSVSKKDQENKQLLKGAHLVVWEDVNHNQQREKDEIRDQWVSEESIHRVKNLIEQHHYILSEEKAPQGYEVAEDILFTAHHDTHIEMYDKEITSMLFSKTDITGSKEIEGAHLIIEDDQHQPIKNLSWVSSTTPHKISGLEEGKTYYLKETIAPQGYVKKTTTIKFIAHNKEKVIMKDATYQISKTDVTGDKELEGAHLVVWEDMNHNKTCEKEEIKDEWISEKKPHYVNRLEENHTYFLTETMAPEGYQKKESVEFKVSGDKDTLYKMKNEETSVTVSKQDRTTSKELSGASLEILNEKGEIVKDREGHLLKWISKEKPHVIRGLNENETYYLKEVIAPKGYMKKEETVAFKVKDNTHVVMKDASVKVSKTDITGQKELPGASLVVWQDLNHNKQCDKNEIVDEWISEEKPHAILNLVEKQTYILTEIKAPEGYRLAENIEFVAGDNDHIVMKDEEEKGDIVVYKVDEHNQPILNQSFAFYLYSDQKCEHLVSKGTLDQKKGKIIFENLRFGLYFMKEVEAPEGYSLDDSPIRIEVGKGKEHQTFTFENKKIHEVVLPPKKYHKVETGDITNLSFLMGLGIISLLVIVGFSYHFYKKRNEL